MGLSGDGFAVRTIAVLRLLRESQSVAGLGAALIAATILTLLTMPSALVPTPESGHSNDAALQQQSRASDPRYAAKAEALLSSTAFDFLGRITDEERLIGRSMHSLSRSWMPAGGISVLTYGVKSNTATAASAKQLAGEIPIPAPSPVARYRALAPSTASTDSSGQSPQMNGDATHNQSFNLLGWLFTPRDYAAKQMLASNPQTAVYDIAAKKLYLPGGQTLEAHSGFGEWMDNPASVTKRSIGVTPPNVYRVSLRPALFHGVRALRLTPEDRSKMFGRSGFLAHPFMLGENGQSNGCVSIKDYDSFLRAYQAGQVTRLMVVPKLGDKIIASANENL